MQVLTIVNGPSTVCVIFLMSQEKLQPDSMWFVILLMEETTAHPGMYKTSKITG